MKEAYTASGIKETAGLYCRYKTGFQACRKSSAHECPQEVQEMKDMARAMADRRELSMAR